MVGYTSFDEFDGSIESFDLQESGLLQVQHDSSIAAAVVDQRVVVGKMPAQPSQIDGMGERFALGNPIPISLLVVDGIHAMC